MEYNDDYPTGPWSSSGSSASVQQIYAYETMTDDPGKGNRMRYVEHTKVRHMANSSNLSTYMYNGRLRAHRGNNAYHYDWQYPPQFDLSSCTAIYPIGIDAQINNALDGFMNTNEVDSLLNIIEAPQLPSAVKSMTDLLKQDSGVKRALSKISNGYLAYSFGLAPLLADMGKIAKAIKTLKSDMEKARKSQGKVTTARHRVSGYLQDNLPLRVVGSLHHKMQTLVVPTRIVTIRGIQRHSYNTRVFNDLSYLMNRFGGRGPASFVWERIPFSFVVDWFVDLRGVCNSLDNLLTGSSKRVMDACVSEKYELMISCTHKNGYYSSSSVEPGEGYAVCGSHLSYYQRKPIAVASKVIGSGRFGKKQLSLSAALLYQQIASRGR